ncbi:hypothetical protein F7731_18680 [Cytobacillus depressus]|uniref:Uncharacterized protein n=1 Tax=Cytobacillus depressus TaxID=1602942 RepID=A0A6L3V5Z5_9BACI|nr:hypothetical protein [Cytobacillus depressus]KAB2331108.1 hypothetical protein F7731_18680 [Cytobacillus depressus]
MKKSKVISFALLFVFSAFLITQYPGGHTKAFVSHEQKAVMSSDSLEEFLLKEDIKKNLFKPTFNMEAKCVLALAFFLFYSKLIRSSRKNIFFTPVFYQSNYVIHSPSFS